MIGSNNGVSFDPIHELVVRNKWDGVFVEPVKYLFDELVKNYENKGGNLNFANVAIGAENKKQSFYRLKHIEKVL